MKIFPAKSLNGNITLPGDKSISHRAAMLAAIAVGETRITNFSTAEDCRTTVKCLEQLGVSFTRSSGDLIVKGVGTTGLRASDNPLDCGNSGTTMRMLTGILAGQSFDSVLTGDESLSKRPMARILSPLSQMGAEIEPENACAPIHIGGGQNLRGIDYELTVASAQVKSCLLLAGLLAKGKTTVSEYPPTRDHTERMLSWFGVEVNVDFGEISINGNSVLTARDLNIPADISSAAFFLVAAACLRGSDIMIPHVGLNRTRIGILNVLKNVGADVQTSMTNEVCNEPVGSIRVRGGIAQTSLAKRLIVAGEAIPEIIDEIPILAVLGTQIDGGIEIREAGELRHKESDRISAMAENLRRMNAVVEEFPDGFKVERSNLTGARVDPFGDHRIAMALAVAGLLAEGETEIENAECVNVSFPGFFEILAKVIR